MNYTDLFKQTWEQSRVKVGIRNLVMEQRPGVIENIENGCDRKEIEKIRIIHHHQRNFLRLISLDFVTLEAFVTLVNNTKMPVECHQPSSNRSLTSTWHYLVY